MITVKLACPVQDTEHFNINSCLHCRYFEQTSGTANFSVRCRIQRTKPHKLAFQSAFYSSYIGRPDRVEVEAKEDKPEEGKHGKEH